jgi:peroxiredoxin
MSQLKIGSKAPDFSAITVYGNDFNLETSLKDGHSLMLSFHRYASCPICNFSLRQFQNAYDELLDQGLRYLPIFHSGVESMQESYPEEPPFTIVSDPQMKLYKQYGLKPSLGAFFHPKALIDFGKAMSSIMQPGYRFRLAPENTLLTKPADFIINPKGNIEYARYGVSLGDSLSLQETREFLAKK